MKEISHTVLKLNTFNFTKYPVIISDEKQILNTIKYLVRKVEPSLIFPVKNTAAGMNRKPNS